MKKWVFSGLIFAALLGVLAGDTSISNQAQTVPPEPAGIIAYQ
ncbi:hypothetical protein [Tumebacillus avium]|nr:hypothetical protein [Tumebacillus avium]